MVNFCRGCGEDCPDTIYCEDCADQIRCPHDIQLGECSACDFEADLAFDASRESAGG